MQADVEDVRPLPEDLLRAVAVVEVDVEDRDALGASREDRLCRDRRVVEEAVAADEAATGMVARRTAEGVRERVARQHAVEGGQRDVDGGVGGARGAGDDRRRGVEAERAQSIVATDRQALERHAVGVRPEEERVRQQRPATGRGRPRSHRSRHARPGRSARRCAPPRSGRARARSARRARSHRSPAAPRGSPSRARATRSTGPAGRPPARRGRRARGDRRTRSAGSASVANDSATRSRVRPLDSDR